MCINQKEAYKSTEQLKLITDNQSRQKTILYKQDNNLHFDNKVISLYRKKCIFC